MEVAALLARVEALEASVGSSTTEALSLPLADRISRIENALSRTSVDLSRVAQTYGQVKPLLEGDAEQALLDNNAKIAFLAAASDDIDALRPTVQQLESLLPFVKSDKIENLPTFTKEVDQLSSIQSLQLDRSNHLGREVDAFVSEYNEALHLLSQKFILYDKKLREWESE